MKYCVKPTWGCKSIFNLEKKFNTPLTLLSYPLYRRASSFSIPVLPDFMLRIFLCFFWLFNFIPDADVKKIVWTKLLKSRTFFKILKNFSVLIRLCALLFQKWLINPPGSTSKSFLQFSKNKFTIPNPVMAIFQGGVIRGCISKWRRCGIVWIWKMAV